MYAFVLEHARVRPGFLKHFGFLMRFGDTIATHGHYAIDSHLHAVCSLCARTDSYVQVA